MAMSMRDLLEQAPPINARGWIITRAEGITVYVQVMNVRESYGRVQFEVSGVSGNGECMGVSRAWIDADRFEAEEV